MAADRLRIGRVLDLPPRQRLHEPVRRIEALGHDSHQGRRRRPPRRALSGCLMPDPGQGRTGSRRCLSRFGAVSLLQRWSNGACSCYARRMRTWIALLALVVFILFSPPADALTISGAKIDKGGVLVKGKGAAPFAQLTWEGQQIAQATKAGTFRFTTSILPEDCVGSLSDGTETVSAIVRSCGPQGVQGPPGEQGEPGPAGFGLVLRDANNQLVGVVTDFVGDDENALITAKGVTVAFRVGSQILAVRMNADGARAFPTSDSNGVTWQLWYQSDDCSGPALVHAGPSTLYAAYTVVGPTVYYATASGESQTVASRAQGEMQCQGTVVGPGQCCYKLEPPEQVPVAPSATFDFASRGLVAPFHLDGSIPALPSP